MMMNKETLDILNTLSKKDTTNLALTVMELTTNNLVLEKENNKQKEVLDKIKEYCKSKIEEQKNMTDFSKYYLENYDKAINIQHLSHSGVMLETIKSTTIKRYEDILELLEDLDE